MKKVCFIELQPYPVAIGGGITHLTELSKALMKEGWDVSIISSRPPKEFTLGDGLNGLHLHHVGLKHKKLEDYKGLKKIYYVFWRVAFEAAFVMGARKILKNNDYDVIDPQSPITPSLACVLSGKQFSITAHGVHNQGFKRLYGEKKDFFVSKIGAPFYNIIEKFNAKRAEKIICLGKDTLDYYKKYNDCVIIPNGIDTAIFSASGKKYPKTIVSVGRFTEQKSVDKLILAMDILKDYKLTIIGTGPLEKQVSQMCSKRKNCQFLGYKSQKEIVKYLRVSSLTILPSLFEGLPISMLESMACGVVPITTKVGDIPSVIVEGKTGMFLENNSPEEIARVVRKSEKADLNRMSKTCMETIKKDYSWDYIAKEYIKAWKKN